MNAILVLNQSKWKLILLLRVSLQEGKLLPIRSEAETRIRPLLGSGPAQCPSAHRLTLVPCEEAAAGRQQVGAHHHGEPSALALPDPPAQQRGLPLS